MIDREKVLTGLECCVNNLYDPCPHHCPYYAECTNGTSFMVLLKDVLELLKKQEPVEPSIDVDTYVCPNCGHRLEHQGMLGDNVIFDELYNFCPACGKAVKYE